MDEFRALLRDIRGNGLTDEVETYTRSNQTNYDSTNDIPDYTQAPVYNRPPARSRSRQQLLQNPVHLERNLYVDQDAHQNSSGTTKKMPLSRSAR